jgi:hypothetical protein
MTECRIVILCSWLAACAAQHDVLPEQGALWRRAAADGCYDQPPQAWKVELSPLKRGRARALACGRDSVYEWRSGERRWQLLR